MGHSPSNPRGIGRRKVLAAWAALQFFPCLALAGEPAQAVVVVFVSGVDAYLEGVNGLRAGLAGLAPGAVFIDLKSPGAEAELTGALGNSQTRVVIAVGAEALTTVSARRANATVISTMILRSDRPRASLGLSSAQRPPAVYLDVPLTSLLSELRILLPKANRFGMIHNSSRDELDPAFPARAKLQGFTLQLAECSRPEDVVKSFLSLKGKADFVVVLPDSSLYNNTTVRPLILASLESRLPLVGFSSSFVRAGAALGVYPDFRDVGAQTADVAARFVAGKTGVSDENPRKLQVAVNQRVLRLLGLNYYEGPGLVIFR